MHDPASLENAKLLVHRHDMSLRKCAHEYHEASELKLKQLKELALSNLRRSAVEYASAVLLLSSLEDLVKGVSE